MTKFRRWYQKTPLLLVLPGFFCRAPKRRDPLNFFKTIIMNFFDISLFIRSWFFAWFLAESHWKKINVKKHTKKSYEKWYKNWAKNRSIRIWLQTRKYPDSNSIYHFLTIFDEIQKKLSIKSVKIRNYVSLHRCFVTQKQTSPFGKSLYSYLVCCS